MDRYAFEKERGMSMTEEELEKLRSECLKLPVEEKEGYRTKDYVLNLVWTVLDFQMKAEVVDAAIDFYSENRRRQLRTHKAFAELVASFPDTKTGNLKLANYLWNNNHWTRAKFLRELLKYFRGRKVRGMGALSAWARRINFRAIKGQVKTEEHSMGYAILKWLQIRLGIDTVKPDVHVKRFVSDCIGRKVKDEETVEAVEVIARELKIPAFRLDAAIWLHQRDKSIRKRRELKESERKNEVEKEDDDE